MIVIYEVIAIGLVIGSLNSAAKLRHDHNFKIFIFKENNVPDLIFLFSFDLRCCRIGIDLAAAALIHSLFKKHWIDVRLSNVISWNLNLLFPNIYCIHDASF